MTLRWKKDGDYFAYADQREDGSRYSMAKLQSGRTYYAIWVWPNDKRKRTDGRELWRDIVYDGPDKAAAVAACNEHYRLRCDALGL